MKLLTFIFLYFFSVISPVAQEKFVIDGNKKEFKVPVELVNDLMIIPVEINGVELFFLLDTGVSSTILFSLGERDSLDLKNTEVIYIRGLGEGEPIKAMKSSGNKVRIGDSFNKSLNLYLVFDNPISLSNRIGVPVHGIIGNDFFKDFVVEFNYTRKHLKAFDPVKYTARNCRKCDELELTFHRKKPYINITGQLLKDTIPLNLLIDSGSADALWLFRDTEKGVVVPEKNFPDFLGFGIGGSIYGLRSRIKGISLGNFDLKEVTTSFPDTLYLQGIETFATRNGSVGAQILKRFHVTLNYPEKKIRLKPNRNYRDLFEYDMSGVIIAHDGFKVIKDILRNPLPLREDDKNGSAAGSLVYKSTYDVKYSLEPEYKIVEIRPDSPAEMAGLQKGDIILKINGRPAYKYTLTEISNLFSVSEGKKIRIQIEREGVDKTVSFLLKRIL